ncbi:hypothetical protein [Streptomyces sp. NBC_01198]|uniref:hypothetical protein n=1 Tax=Streptomyces sp. NBC_01198 TaxID=2903769 RepID=UPI002E0F63F0|nr:hypothetical protein OG702_32105 [Streptomyces sp. NBC_01198]
MSNTATATKKSVVSLKKTPASIELQGFRASVNAGLRANDLEALADHYWFESVIIPQHV